VCKTEGREIGDQGVMSRRTRIQRERNQDNPLHFRGGREDSKTWGGGGVFVAIRYLEKDSLKEVTRSPLAIEPLLPEREIKT